MVNLQEKANDKLHSALSGSEMQNFKRKAANRYHAEDGCRQHRTQLVNFKLKAHGGAPDGKTDGELN